MNSKISLFEWNEQKKVQRCNKKRKGQNLQWFLEDLKVSKELTEERYNQRSNWIKFKQSIAKLASPIL